jgi:hypothetical protein
MNIPGIWENWRATKIEAAYKNVLEQNNSIYKMQVSDLGFKTDPMPQAAANIWIAWNQAQWSVPNAALPTDFSLLVFGDNDPTTFPGLDANGNPTENGAVGITKISDLRENFAMATPILSKSDGLEIGALHWNNHVYNSAISTAAVKAAYANPIIPNDTPYFNLTTFKGKVPAGDTIVTMNGKQFLKVRLNGWNTQFPIAPVTFTKGTQVSFTYKYDKDTTSYSNTNVLAFVQFMVDEYANDGYSDVIDNPIKDTLTTLKANTTPNTYNMLQLAAQYESGGWPAINGGILYIGQMQFNTPFSLTDFTGDVPAGDTIVTVNGQQFLKVRLNAWNTTFPIAPIALKANDTISFSYRIDKDTSTYVGQSLAFFQLFDTKNVGTVTTDNPYSNTLVTKTLTAGRVDTMLSIQLADQSETRGWPALAGPIMYLGKFNLSSLSFQQTSIVAGSNNAAIVGNTIEIPVSTSQLQTTDSIISYQFVLNYDGTKLEYLSCDLSGTIASGGTINVNSGQTGKLNIGYMNSTPISGNGAIANIKFKVISQGNSTLSISNFLYNVYSINNITNGSVSTISLLGDVDLNGYVQAYDAALVLQYSVGIDPMPSVAPLPWEPWRIATADVDGVSGITANDASLILQKSIGLITKFPVENTKKSGQINNADVVINVENNFIVFYSQGSLFGLNVNADNSNNILGTPVLLDSSLMEVFNNKNYAIGVATAYPPADNTAFMKIPYNNIGSVTFNMVINTVSKSETVSIATGISKLSNSSISIYPNPASGEINVKSAVLIQKLEIYDLEGKLIELKNVNAYTSKLQMDGYNDGIYMLKLYTVNGISNNKLVIKK